MERINHGELATDIITACLDETEPVLSGLKAYLQSLDDVELGVHLYYAVERGDESQANRLREEEDRRIHG